MCDTEGLHNPCKNYVRGHLCSSKWSEVPSHSKDLQHSKEENPPRTMLEMDHLRIVAYFISHVIHTSKTEYINTHS